MLCKIVYVAAVFGMCRVYDPDCIEEKYDCHFVWTKVNSLEEFCSEIRCENKTLQATSGIMTTGISTSGSFGKDLSEPSNHGGAIATSVIAVIMAITFAVWIYLVSHGKTEFGLRFYLRLHFWACRIFHTICNRCHQFFRQCREKWIKRQGFEDLNDFRTTTAAQGRQDGVSGQLRPTPTGSIIRVDVHVDGETNSSVEPSISSTPVLKSPVIKEKSKHSSQIPESPVSSNDKTSVKVEPTTPTTPTSAFGISTIASPLSANLGSEHTSLTETSFHSDMAQELERKIDDSTTDGASFSSGASQSPNLLNDQKEKSKKRSLPTRKMPDRNTKKK